MGITLKSDKDGTPMSPDAQIFSKNDIEKLETQLRSLEKESDRKIGELEDENKELKTANTRLEKEVEAQTKRYDALLKDYNDLYKSHQELDMKRLLVKSTFSDVGASPKRRSSED